MTITFITGNKFKFDEAVEVMEPYGITVLQEKVSIDEIQSTDVVEIAIDKAKKAYAVLQRPLVVTDAGWGIPALNGFPGAYMKDVNNWFTPQDWLNLMQDKSDRSATIREATVFIDGDLVKVFTRDTTGVFVDHIAGNSLSGFDKVVSFVDSGETISEVYDKALSSFSRKENLWHDFARWYKTQG
jgi:XTP/dITP diphosphohydrolase